jgi:hypothetical protein
MSVAINIPGHDQDEATVGSVDTSEHEWSDGPYAVVKLTVGGFALTYFPKGEHVQRLGEVLSELGAELLRLAPELAPKVEALTE